MDQRHLTFLMRNGLDTYNCYFNRDKKRIIEPDIPNGISLYEALVWNNGTWRVIAF